MNSEQWDMAANGARMNAPSPTTVKLPLNMLKLAQVANGPGLKLTLRDLQSR